MSLSNRTQRERRQPRAEMPKPVSVVESGAVASRDWGKGKRGMAVSGYWALEEVLKMLWNWAVDMVVRRCNCTDLLPNYTLN